MHTRLFIARTQPVKEQSSKQDRRGRLYGLLKKAVECALFGLFFGRRIRAWPAQGAPLIFWLAQECPRSHSQYQATLRHRLVKCPPLRYTLVAVFVLLIAPLVAQRFRSPSWTLLGRAQYNVRILSGKAVGHLVPLGPQLKLWLG